MRGKNLAALVLFLGILLINPQSLLNFVVCFGDNGSIQIEKAYGGECYPKLEQRLQKSSHLATKGFYKTSCQACRDIPIFCSNETLLLSQKQLEKITPLFLSTRNFMFPPFVQTKRIRYSHPFQAISTFTLKTIVLLV